MELPQAFKEKMERLLGAEYTEFLESYEKERKQGLRLNLLKTSREKFEQEAPFSLSPIPWTEEGYYYGKEDRPGLHPYHEAGVYYIQEPSAQACAEALDPRPGERILDLCAAPGGKSLHMGDKMEGYGVVDARDVSDYKVGLIEENIQRTESINVQAKVQDATVFDVESECKADIVLADVPCSGYGVIGKKPEIKYRVTAQKQEEIVILQRTILSRAAEYVKSRGTLIFSTCTIAKEENEENMMWFLQNYPFKLESLDPYLPEELHSETTALGYLQLLPGVHKTDGFFIAKFRRK